MHLEVAAVFGERRRRPSTISTSCHLPPRLQATGAVNPFFSPSCASLLLVVTAQINTLLATIPEASQQQVYRNLLVGAPAPPAPTLPYAGLAANPGCRRAVRATKVLADPRTPGINVLLSPTTNTEVSCGPSLPLGLRCQPVPGTSTCNGADGTGDVPPPPPQAPSYSQPASLPPTHSPTHPPHEHTQLNYAGVALVHSTQLYAAVIVNSRLGFVNATDVGYCTGQNACTLNSHSCTSYDSPCCSRLCGRITGGLSLLGVPIQVRRTDM